MGPWLLPPHSTNVCGFRHSPPSCGGKEGCDPPVPVPVPGSHGRVLKQEGAVSPTRCPVECLGKALLCCLGRCRLCRPWHSPPLLRLVGVWGLWTHLQSWRVLVPLSRTILE